MRILKSCIIILTALMCPIQLLAQNLSAKDSLWRNWNADRAQKLNLINLSSTDEAFHWRFGYYGQVTSYFIDLIVKNNQSTGYITIYTDEYVDVTKEIPTNRIYDEKTIFRPKQADSAYQLIQKFKIADLPKEELIKGWETGMDGVTYSVELRDNNNYLFKTYWTPDAQENVLEAKKLIEFIKTVETVVELRRLEQNLKEHIPFESYNTGGPATAIRVLTKKQRKQYRKERDAYRKKMHIVEK